MKMETKNEMVENVKVADKRLGMTAFIYSVIMLTSSIMPEETFLKWFIINSVFTLSVLFTLIMLWEKYKHDTVRYYSYQVYAMLMGIVFFGITPILKLTYQSSSFWIILFVTLTLLVSAHLLRNRIVISFVNKKHRVLLSILSIYMIGMIVLGIIVTFFMRVNESTDNVGVSLLFYLVSTMFIVIAPAFTVSKEDVERLTLE
ncbi:MAG TPA: hypothetical protein VLQ66_07580 [Paenisporosarcina sp.]|nr:hypothetical protein [Paenisporosarcina sp.]